MALMSFLCSQFVVVAVVGIVDYTCENSNDDHQVNFFVCLFGINRNDNLICGPNLRYLP